MAEAGAKRRKGATWLNTILSKWKRGIMEEVGGKISRQSKLQHEYDQSLGRKLDKYFCKVAVEFDKVNSRLDKVDSRLGNVETDVKEIKETLSRIEGKLDK